MCLTCVHRTMPSMSLDFRAICGHLFSLRSIFLEKIKLEIIFGYVCVLLPFLSMILKL